MKKMLGTICFIAVFLLVSGCQASLAPSAAPAALPPAPTLPLMTPIPLPSDTPGGAPSAALPSATPAGQPTGDADRGPALAAAAVRRYFTALQAGDAQAASRLLSTMSLVIDGMTRGDAAAELEGVFEAGSGYSGLQILDSQVFDEKTVLVHVSYQLAARDTATGKTTTSQVDELWPVRREAGVWLVNRHKVIDYHSLDVPEQLTAGLTVEPRELIRYSDHIRMVFLAQNGTNEAIVLGQPSEVIATFIFGSQRVDAEQNRLIFDRLRSYPDAAIDVKGLFKQYPDGVEIRRWKNYNVAPWFTFHFGG